MASIVESFVSDYLLKKLVDFTKEKVVMIHGVKDDIIRLEARMKHIALFLKDAERRSITDGSIKNWLTEIKDVMYDADDIFDLWRYKIKSLLSEDSSSCHSPKCCPLPFLSCFRSVPMRYEIAQHIKILNIRLEGLFKDMSRLNLQQIPSEVRKVNGVDGRVSSPVMGVDIVGNEIEEDANKLVKLATMNSKQKFNIVAITGMGGIGKTALAQKIYNNQTIQNKYAIKMWLHISQSYSNSQLIKEAIRNAGGNPGQVERESELLPILANVISGKSFFLVLDDVWKPDIWVNLLQDPLKTNATLGFILVTTRDQTIAMQMGSNHIHQARILSTRSGWELLCRRAYLTDTMDIQSLEGIGTEIVKKCGGLPLAVKTIAAMLTTKGKTKGEWEKVLNNSMWLINGLPKEIDRALYLSYEDLSPQLKQCFLYCSLYPYQPIYMGDIVEAWIAEGFIEETEDQMMEDKAEECYDELIKRHLLEPLYPFIVDQTFCVMHDLLRSLGQYLSSGESFRRDKVSSDVVNLSRLRRLFITETNETSCILGSEIEPLKLRTFHINKCLSTIETPIFTRLRNLRILCINEKGLRNIPDSIGDLIHLRELALDRTSISNLPESISSLTNLLFLNLSGCEFLHTLPRGITRLYNLRHLKLLNTPLTFVPKGLGALTKLTQILDFQVGGDGDNGWSLQELEGLFQLRCIRITKLERVRNFTTAIVLENKSHLKILNLEFSDASERGNDHVVELEDGKCKEVVENLCPPHCLEILAILNYNGKVLPSWLSSSSMQDNLANLQYLQLINCFCTDLPPLGILPNLKYLVVKGASSIVTISSGFIDINIRNDLNFPVAFPKLEYLEFIDMPNWEEWMLPDFGKEKSPSWQLMPHIKMFSILKCPKLRALPESLQQISTIEHFFLVSEAHSLKSIQDLTFECNGLCVLQNKCLEIISNLPCVKKLIVETTHNLRQVSKLDSVEYILLKDYETEGLPKWLVNLREEREHHMDYKLHLELFCKTTLLMRCIKDGLEWPIIKCFSSVNIYNKELNASLHYTREPESYFASL